jgi:hypothetical protein
LHYNENKVKAGKAHLIGTNGYLKNLEKLSFSDKLFRLTDLAERNQRTKTNTLHLSLNFEVNEHIDKEQLVSIASEYMDRIGFGFQPFLIYNHFDAGHPHIHIVTTNIQADGNRISLHNIGKERSEPARKAIEIEFGLVQAGYDDKSQKIDPDAHIRPLEYGETDVKRGITNIVNAIAKSYKFTSLPEFNAILKQFNIMADRGSKESLMFKKGGLRYWVVDSTGKKLGVPIKASSIYNKPTLKLLEQRFTLNEVLRKPFRDKLKSRIDHARAKSGSLEQFKSELKKADVHLIIRNNDEGRIYGMSYIDNLYKTIFNGSDIGKNYSAAGIVNSFNYSHVTEVAGALKKEIRSNNAVKLSNDHPVYIASKAGLLEDLLSPLVPDHTAANDFEPKKKKKKRRKLNL